MWHFENASKLRNITMLLINVFILYATICTADVSFIFPSGQSIIYTGYLWEGTKNIYIRPRLQASPRGKTAPESSLCDIKIISLDGSESPLVAKITDAKYGFADLLVKEQKAIKPSAIFYLEAYDCSEPPHVSSRVPIRIHLITGSGPYFVESSYTFTVSHENFVNGFVGQVQAIARPSNGEQSMYSSICNYLIGDPDSPFDIDRNGLIRVRHKLDARPNEKPYMLKVIAEDCNRPVPRRASVDVIVRQIAQGCQAGWKGLPTRIEYPNSLKRPGRLLHKFNLALEFCVNMCESPEIRTRLELQSAVKGYILPTANSGSCLHDPEHLTLQQKICGLHPTTLINFLPTIEQDIPSQLINPNLGNFPRLFPPAMVWRFNASERTVWQVDPNFLNVEKGTNAFDLDFTITFWVRRYPGLGNYMKDDKEEEIVLCSQDAQEPNWRFLSIGFNKCYVIVRLLASLKHTPVSLDNEPRRPSVWTFGPLPEQYCVPPTLEQTTWRHFAVTFSRTRWGSSPELVSLLVDGKELGELGTPTQTRMPGLPPYSPGASAIDPRITVGACYDPITKLTTNHLNADLAGLTVLTQRAEVINNVRCVAQCGESLIVPDIQKHLKSDVSVDLENQAITIFARNVSHIVELLQSIVYVRPQPGISPGYTPYAVQSRILNLTTAYSCTNVIELPTSEIQMKVLPEFPDPTHSIEIARPTNDIQSESMWIPQNVNILDRPQIAKADMEKKAWLNSRLQPFDKSPPALLIVGSDVVITEPPFETSGVPVFADIRFVLPEEGESPESNAAAAAVPLDSCIVWISSTKWGSGHESKMGAEYDEGRIQWSLDLVRQRDLVGVDDKHGVELRGEKPAVVYADTLRTFHYVPPHSLKLNNSNHSSSIRFVAKIGVICTSDSGKKTTSQHSVKIVFESPDEVSRDLATEESIHDLSLEDNEDFPDNLPLDVSQQQNTRGKQRLKARDIGNEVPDLEPASKPSNNNHSLAIGLSVTALIIVAVIGLLVFVFVKKRNQRKPARNVGRRRRFPAQPADFGGSSLKQDPTLRLTANPIGEVEYRGIGIVSEDLYGSSRNIASRDHIFSPPLPLLSQHEEQNLWAGAHLAGLDEFDENDEFDDQNDEFGGRDSNVCDSPPIANETGLHRSVEHEVGIHEWIDQDNDESQLENEEQEQLDPLSRDQVTGTHSETKCTLVTQCDPDDFGSPVVDL